MKKFLILLLVIIIVVSCFIFYNSKSKNESNQNVDSLEIKQNDSVEETHIEDPSKGTIVDVQTLKNKRILVEKHYINYAYSFEHRGLVICTDGTMYNYEYGGQEELPERPFEKIVEASDEILAHVTTFEGRIPKDEIDRLTELLTTISADYTYSNVEMSKGEDTIIYYNYEKNEIVTLKSGGDNIVKNNSKNTEKILTILEDYHIRLEE